jgi:protein-tyrosine phosphatase
VNIESTYTMSQPSDIQEVVPSVFISNYFGARNKTKLTNVGITHIVVCAQELDCCHPDTCDYLKLKIADNPSQNISDFFESTNAHITEALETNGKVLLHCAGGASRSAAMMVAYLMSLNNNEGGRMFTFETAYTHLRSVRPVIYALQSVQLYVSLL